MWVKIKKENYDEIENRGCFMVYNFFFTVNKYEIL